MELNNIKDQRFGRLVAIEYVGNSKWLCKCDCGNTKIISGKSLRKGYMRSCGCLQTETRKNGHNKTHGLSKTSLSNIYFNMKARCYNKNEKAYKDYGARGITICDEWFNDKTKFFEWAKNNGFEEGLTIDRIDNNGNYEPSNCRWADIKTQCRNRRSNHLITYKNETHTLVEWSEILGFRYSQLLKRINRNWSVERAFTTPTMVNQFI